MSLSFATTLSGCTRPGAAPRKGVHQLISIIVDKTGVDRARAEQAVDAIMGFMKENPEKITELLGEHAPANVSKTIGKLFRR